VVGGEMMKAPSACHKVMWPQNCWATGSEMIHAPSTKSDVAEEFVRRLAVRSPTFIGRDDRCTSGTAESERRITELFPRQKHHGIHCFQGGSIMVILLMWWKQTAQVSQLKSELLFLNDMSPSAPSFGLGNEPHWPTPQSATKYPLQDL